MAHWWVNLLIQYGKDVAKSIVTLLCPCLKRHFDYWWCFDGNVQDLKDEITNLEREMSDMNQKIEEARLDGKIPTTHVQNLSNEGTQKLEEAKRISRGCDDLKVWKICPRYSKGKSAKETAKGIAKLRNQGNSIRIADPAPPASMVSITRAPTLEFQSRKSIEEDIMNSLKDGNVQMIAICGLGGVGKTTMAERIVDRAIQEKLFDEVVFVVISKPIDKLQIQKTRQQFDKLSDEDMFKIQKQIAEMLGLGLREETLDGRAHRLRTRLTDSKKKLVIFDDVWESFQVKDIGVPYANGDVRCKIILTSRNTDVCREMGANEVIEIKVLDEEEAWTLFREKSKESQMVEGKVIEIYCVDNLDLRPIAKEVAAECNGLPLALATVGIALKDKLIPTWKDALLQLRGANPTNFQQVRDNVYKPLKLSYDFLETDDQNLFLLCCLFPEDYDIQIEDLALLSFGLRLFKGINNIENGRNRTFHLLEKLRSRFLLMTGRHEDEVKMHDVVRDVAIYIGSSRNYNWMSVANAMFPTGLEFRNLCLLMILNSNYFKFPEGMKELTVLYFSNQNFQSLPSSLKSLENLRKLHLYNCKVNDISVVGKLESLEILRIFWCNDIEKLPSDVGKLKFLRLLELRACKKLKRIVAGVISSLVGLEELKIVDCFDKWEAKGNVSEERNASLSELESLCNLTSLEIDIFDPNLVAKQILLSKHLRRYQIRVYRDQILFDGTKHERKITLFLPEDVVTVGNWIRPLVKNTELLALDGDGSNNFNLGEMESLRNLVLQHCSTVKKLANAVDCRFPMLEHLKLRELRELEEIIDGTIPEGSNSFQNLQSLVVHYLPKLRYLWKSPNQNVNLVNLNSIDIFKCPKLRSLFSMATARSLVQLQSLEIYDCDTMEKVLWNETESNTEASISEFPKLKKLILFRLPNLLAFTQGVEIIKFPQLIQLEIQDCPKLRTKIDKCPTCMIEKLLVRNRDTIDEIFRDDGNRHIIFQELYQLELSGLPRLTTFYEGVESIKFPKLENLRIGNLPMLNGFVAIDSEPTHDHHSLHFFCNKKVEMIGLKELHLCDLPDEISKIWCRHIPINSFHNLESLSIFNVHGIRNSISSSVANNLVNLKKLFISNCKEMMDVIDDEIHAPVNSVFPKLEYLHLRNNCKLKSFFQWKHAFELPSLEDVQIANCPLMNTFSLGSLSTPKLNWFNINEKDIEMKDLNGGIHHFISTEITNKDENKDEYSRDEYSAEDEKEIEGKEMAESSNSINLM